MAIPLRYNSLSILARPTSTLSAVTLIAVVIAVFCYLQAITDSAFETMAKTGDPLSILVFSQSANSETVSGIGKDGINKLELAPSAVKNGSDALISAELVAISSAPTKKDPDVQVNAAVRGVEFDVANKVRRDSVEILEGRLFEPGRYEVIVGVSAVDAYVGHTLGSEIEIGNRGVRQFKIVGIFTTGGTAADSEIWGYVETLRDVYNRSGYSSARLRASSESEAEAMIAYIEGPSVELTAKTERDYYSNMGRGQQATQVFSIAMVVIMGIACAFAVANTMYAAVAGRTREIGMLRAIGFTPTSVLTGFVLEGMLLSFAGGALGCLLSLFSNGMSESILPEAFTTVSYTMYITPKIVVVSMAVALTIGFFGSILPARRAALLPVTRALRES